MSRYPSRESPRLPDTPEKFFRVSLQRLDESRFLFDGKRYAGAIYLAGYSVECGLKALILSTVSKRGRKEVANSFRGSGWHKLNRLLDVYIDRGSPRPPSRITRAFIYVNDEWSVDLRYVAGERPFREAERFLDSTEIILDWIKGRL